MINSKHFEMFAFRRSHNTLRIHEKRKRIDPDYYSFQDLSRKFPHSKVLVFSLSLKMSKKSIKDYFNVAQLENHGPNHSQKATIIQTPKLACFILRYHYSGMRERSILVVHLAYAGMLRPKWVPFNWQCYLLSKACFKRRATAVLSWLDCSSTGTTLARLSSRRRI